jgi:hypothetical protein
LIFSVLKALHFKVTSEVSEAEGMFDFLIHVPPGTVFIAEFKYEKLAIEPGEKNDEKNEIKRRNLLIKALNDAKAQIKCRRYEARFSDEYPVVKKLAVGIVGKTDVVAEIY